MKKLTQSEFVARATKKHGGKYDLTKSKYVNGYTKIVVSCPVHGDFLTIPKNFLFGQGCPQCGVVARSIKRTKSIDFVKEARKVHKKEYEYTKTQYVNKKTPVCITCRKHGDFFQIPSLHLNGCGCPACGTERTTSTTRKTTEKFIEEAKRVHGNKYDYSKVSYKKALGKVSIICPEHGIFQQTAASHLSGRGCPWCGGTHVSDSDLFIKKAKVIHGDVYDYSHVNYINKSTKVEIICPTHGAFMQTPDGHLCGRGCPMCKRSLGEEKVSLFLEKYNIVSIPQYKVINESLFCSNKDLLCDFYLPTYNAVVEYNGKQHYMPIEQFGGQKQFELQQERDMALRLYCKEYKIKLIEIPYWDYNNIETILKKELNLK